MVLGWLYNKLGLKYMLLIIKHKKCVIKSSDIGIKTKIGHNAVVMKGSCIDSLSEIGSYCYIGKYCYITKTTIGNYCSIANNIAKRVINDIKKH